MERAIPHNSVYWLDSNSRKGRFPHLEGKVTADVAIIGGGLAGLSCADRLLEDGNHSLVLIDKDVVGTGATGKSGGFLVPSPEKDLSEFIKNHGIEAAQDIWALGASGVEYIINVVGREKIDCELAKGYALYLANTEGARERIRKEVEAIQKLKLKGEVLDKDQIREHVGSRRYLGGGYLGGTHSFDPYAYCHDLAWRLTKHPKFSIFEHTEAQKVVDRTIYTPDGEISAGKIVFCSDRFVPEGINQSGSLPHIQTFVLISYPLSESAAKKIFSNSPNTLAWDSDLIYHYFRLTEDRRLLLGGGDLLSTYADTSDARVDAAFSKLQDYIDQTFPDINIRPAHIWSGVMGISDDFLGLIGKSDLYPDYYFNVATTGLSVAAGGGVKLAEAIINGNDPELPSHFSPNRRLLSNGKLGRVVGPQKACALSHAFQLISS